MRRRLLIVTVTLSLGGGGLARAQEDDVRNASDAADPPAAAAAEEPAGKTNEDQNATVRLPKVVVTARKWTEELADVPQSVTVLDDAVIRDAGIRSIADASIYVPNLRLTEFTARRLSFPFIRGIGSGQGDPAVTTYLDGVPQLATGTTNIPLLDIERIEFLRGPQSTLYGRNALGGLIHVITRPPSDVPEFEAGVTIGNFGLLETTARFSAPLVEDKVSLSLSGLFLDRDGYVVNDFTGDDVNTKETYFGRGQLLFTPDERNEIRFSIHGEYTRDGGFTLSGLQGLREHPYQINQDFQGVTNRDIVAPSLTWSYAGDSVDFTSISAYQYLDIFESTDFDFTALDAIVRRTTESLNGFVQEVRFSSAEDVPLDMSEDVQLAWIGGALFFYGDSDESAANEFRPGAVGIFTPIPGVDTQSGSFNELGVGVYGQITATFGDRLDLGAGLRYDYEHKEADLQQTFESGGFPLSSASQSLDDDFDEFLPSFSALYRVSDAVSVYGRAARGFKAGGFNLSAPPGDIAFQPETSWTYEGGVKATLFDERLSIDAAYFYIDWNDMQLSQFDINSGGYVTNAGQSTSQGVEIEVAARPAEGFDVFAAFGYTDATFDSYIDQYGTDVAGNTLPFAPDTTWSVGAQLSCPLAGGSRVFVRGEYAAVGEYFYDPGNLESERFEVVNFRAGVSSVNWRIEAWIRNAFDDAYVPLAFQPSPFDPSVFVGENGAPRMWGVTVSMTF